MYQNCILLCCHLLGICGINCKLHIIFSRHFSGELVQQDSLTLLIARKVLTGFGSHKEGYYHRPQKWNPTYHELDSLDRNKHAVYIPWDGEFWHKQRCSPHTMGWTALISLISFSISKHGVRQFTKLHEQIQNENTCSHKLTATNISLMIRLAPCCSSALKNYSTLYRSTAWAVQGGSTH